jgi:L-fuconolactonase
MSGLWTEAPAGQAVEAVRPWCEALMKTWGAQRLLWGSDWPVLELAGSYAEWRQLSLQLLAPWSEQDQNAVLGGNARRIYGL